MEFEARALSRDRTVCMLSIDAVDEAEARRQIEGRGLHVSSLHPVHRMPWGNLGRRAAGRSGGSGRISLVLFSQELLSLLKAGLSIVEALEALLDKEAAGATRAALSRLLSGLRDGKRFSAVLAEQPALFPPLYIGMIQAAEGTSDLPRALERFLDYRQRVDSIRSKVISASIYPIILLIVGGGVTFFLIGFVVPRFASVYRDAGRDLPWLSRLLLEWGQFASNHTASLLSWALAFLLLLAFGIRHALSQQNILPRLLGMLPGIGERMRIYELSRLYLTLGMLLEGGIPIVAAMDTVRESLSAHLRQGLQSAQTAVRSGMPLSTAFENSRLTTPISLRMLRVGERSGELGQMLTQSATFYDGEISRWIERFTRTFEPILMAMIGLVIGTIVVLLYMPIFDLAGSLS